MKKGDLVRVKQSSGKLSTQRYQLEKIDEDKAGFPFRCWITIWPSEGKPKWEEFDTDLLVVDNSGPAALAAMFR